MLIVVIVCFKAIDAFLSMKFKPGLIPRFFKSSVNDVNSLIISVSLLLFIDVVRMELHSYTYIYIDVPPPPLEVVGKYPHRSD